MTGGGYEPRRDNPRMGGPNWFDDRMPVRPGYDDATRGRTYFDKSGQHDYEGDDAEGYHQRHINRTEAGKRIREPGEPKRGKRGAGGKAKREYYRDQEEERRRREDEPRRR